MVTSAKGFSRGSYHLIAMGLRSTYTPLHFFALACDPPLSLRFVISLFLCTRTRQPWNARTQKFSNLHVFLQNSQQNFPWPIVVGSFITFP